MSGTLFIVATPIGNLEDLSPRARQTLATVDLVAAEDTRHSGRLLSHFGIETRQIPLHEHNESQASGALVGRLEAGESIALVSDAGTPLVSDPGFRLVRACQDAGIPVIPIPGPSAVMAALSTAGLATDRFCFEGFLPAKRQARRERLEALRGETRTIVFFESVHRIRASLDDLAGALGADRETYLGRELTKLHEQGVRATLADLGRMLDDGTIAAKGEFVVAVAGAPARPGAGIDVDRLLAEIGKFLPTRETARIVARATGLRPNDLYRRLIELGAADQG